MRNKSCFKTISFKEFNSSCEYKYPVGFPGLQINIAFVFGVINFSNSEIEGRENPLSIVDVIGFTITPAEVENPL